MNPRQQKAIQTAYRSIAGNTLLALVKGVAGVFGNSYALVADAIESATDVFTSILIVLGIRYAQKPADDNHPYGHGKAEAVVTFIVVGFLVVAACVIVHESVQNIQTPHELPETYTLWILALVVAAKEGAYQYVIRKSRQTKSTILHADAWHHRSDAATSLMAFIGIAIALIMGEGYESADDWAALFAAGFILYNAYKIFRPALGEIMDEQLYDDLINDIRTVCMSVEGVMDTEKCFVRKSGMTFQVDLHLLVHGDLSVREGHDIAHEAKRRLIDEISGISDALIHIEPHDAH